MAVALATIRSMLFAITASYVAQVQNVTFLFLSLRFVRKEKMRKLWIQVILYTQRQCLFTIFLLCSYLCTLVLAYDPVIHAKPLIFHPCKHCCSILTGRFGHNRTMFQHKCYQKGRQQGHNNYTHTHNGVNTAHALHWTSHSGTIRSTGFS